MSFEFSLIERAAYPRNEHFEHFFGMQLTYSATVSIDITGLRRALKSRGVRAYPAQIWILANAVNQIPEFRMSVDPEGNLGIFDHLDPLYTVFNDQTKTFSSIWTPYSSSFGDFHTASIDDIDQFNTGAYLPQGEPPINVLNVSSVPWLEFTSFNLNLPANYTLPIFTIGRYIETNGMTMMPLAIQVHHAICDGYHLGLFVDALRDLASTSASWLESGNLAGD